MKVRAGSLRDELGLNPLFVTQNGKESLVVQTHEAYEHQQEKIAFMEILINSRKDIESGKTELMDDFLNSVEEKIGMAEKENTDQQNNTFTKSMLVSGEHVVKLRDGSYNLVMKDRISDLGGWLSLDHLSEDLHHLDREYSYNNEDLDIVAVYSLKKYFTLNNLEDGKELTLIWQRESPEKQKQLEVIQTLEEDLKRAQKALEEAKSKLEEM